MDQNQWYHNILNSLMNDPLSGPLSSRPPPDLQWGKMKKPQLTIKRL